MPSTLGYALLEIGGIQAFILETGKLKEMIGGSEIIESLSQGFYDDVLHDLGLREIDEPDDGDNHWIIPVQKNAGTLRLLFPDLNSARSFVTVFSRHAVQQFPGLPLYGTVVEADWEKGLKEPHRDANAALAVKRSLTPPSSGMPMLPVVRTARLDGLPAVEKDKKELISLLSRTKRQRHLLEKADARLKTKYEPVLHTLFPDTTQIVWTDDFDRMIGDHPSSRIALVHIDGNDLGKRFQKTIEDVDRGNLSTAESVARLNELSSLVQNANEYAFSEALAAAVARDVPHADWKRYVVPARPLVMGGDDVSVIIRADLALTFIEHYVQRFEQKTREGGTPLTVGVGMVVMPKTYPFTKAFTLVENLLESAKHATINMTPRPSSLDYLVLTEEVESSLAGLRERTATTLDGEGQITCKPLFLTDGALSEFTEKARSVLEKLPRSGIRNAVNECRR
ncbi:MAG: Cas10/Cmr2 second palm domain-containing protein, partial [Desulfovibrionales bacterium]